MPTDNSDLEAKILIRRAAIAAVDGDAVVLDCFAGEGHMYQEVWHDAARYLGLDKRFSRPPGHPSGQCWRGDNARLVAHAIAKDDFNIVDLDAYGGPWLMLRQVVKAMQRERFVVTATCGIIRNLRTNGLSHFVTALAGLGNLSYTTLILRWYDDIVRWSIAYACTNTPYRVTRCRRARSASSQNVYYYVIEFERVSRGP